MSNTILTPSIIAKEALMVLQNNLVMANLVHRDYSSDFANVGDTISVRKPATFTAKDFTGSIVTQDATESSVAVKLDRHIDVSFAVSSKELTLDINNFSEQLIAPAVRAIAQRIDVDVLNTVEDVSNSVTGTASPTNLSDIGNISKTMDLKGVPADMRRLVLHPTHKYRYGMLDNLAKVSYAGNGDMLRNAELGRLFTLDTYMDQNCPDTSASTAGTATAYKITGTKGESKVAIANLSSATATVKKGDGFIIDGYRYFFTEDGTGASSAIEEIDIDRPLMKTYSTATAVTIINAPVSLAFHRNAIALVTRPLAIPLGAANASIVSENGFGIRVVYGYDQSSKTDTVSLDVLYGVKTLNNDLMVKLVG